jgi:undecaprenyl-diphosphatase
MTWIEVFVLALIEGITEFLPISSTGHLIVASHALGVGENPFTIPFNIIIQFGAILSVLVLYWRRFLAGPRVYRNLFFAVLPAVVLGMSVKDQIDRILSSTHVVAWAFILGGVILIWSDRFFKEGTQTSTLEGLDVRKSALIGVAQCFAFIPGMSRAASAILGGMGVGLSRKDATEFSFLLAVPTLTGASLVKAIQVWPSIEPQSVQYLAGGVVLSFLFALAAIQFLLSYISRHGFKHFGIYRIVLGLIILSL